MGKMKLLALFTLKKDPLHKQGSEPAKDLTLGKGVRATYPTTVTTRVFGTFFFPEHSLC